MTVQKTTPDQPEAGHKLRFERLGIPMPPDWRERATVAERVIAECSDRMNRLDAFVQWVADHSNDPAVVKEARAHGAK